MFSTIQYISSESEYTAEGNVRTDLGFGVEMWPAGPGRMVRQWSDGYMPYVGGRASERLTAAARTNHYYSFFLILTNEVPCTHHGKPTISSTQRGIAGPPSTNRKVLLIDIPSTVWPAMK